MSKLESEGNTRWQETRLALESVRKGETVEAYRVEQWLNSWGKPDELPAPKVQAFITDGRFSRKN